jgi:Fur family transcriptional regulator, zinc uptake regulator
LDDGVRNGDCTRGPRAMKKLSLADVAKLCSQRGLRLTPLRADVLQLVTDSQRPVKAYDVLGRIRESVAITAPPTVYRTLDFLRKHGFIHKLESINAYAACVDPSTPHTGTFLICDACQAAIELTDDQLGAMLEKRARDTGFTAHSTTQTLEVHGLCASCSPVERIARTQRRHTD